MSSMIDYYAARAAEYDRVYAKPERQADLQAITAWLPGHFVGGRVLELACGTGWWTQHLAPAAASVLALDAAPETLAIARQRVTAPTVRFIVGDACTPPAADPPFDAAFAGFWFSHLPRAQRTAFVQALHAVLAPGATVVLLDNRFVPGSSTAIAETDAAGDSWQLRALADGSVHRVLKNFPREDELCELLAAIGVSPADMAWTEWPHYWAACWRTPGAPR
jgi:ubiquinone/menaquinone biosynthesis C-methylase UbiE